MSVGLQAVNKLVLASSFVQTIKTFVSYHRKHICLTHTYKDFLSVEYSNSDTAGCVAKLKSGSVLREDDLYY